LIGTPSCPLPTHDLRWIPTHQPIALRHWPITPGKSRSFSTIGKWEHTADRNVEFAGERYFSSKATEWHKLLDLPSKTTWEPSLAVQSMPPAVQQQFRQHGWSITDAESVTPDCPSFQRFIQDSAGELTVAKQIYSAIPSGWFSDRSACYLASGRPVVTQSTGFENWLPTGEGLFAFATCDEAADALDRIAGDYEPHSRAARHLAETYFDSGKVLSDLLQAVM
jgi:predicted acyl esterase